MRLAAAYAYLLAVAVGVTWGLAKDRDAREMLLAIFLLLVLGAVFLRSVATVLQSWGVR